ncbi:MAG: hypothetical protein Ct9H300mP3_10550 [Gammaproteobacteria bacterium]|nr:MAG: hypothetical protein Ct9H300mP3_10550 [Gammaproteobacteria bacterium]
MLQMKMSLKTGMRQEGFITRLGPFFGKASNGVGHLVAGFALKYIGFPENAIPSQLPDDLLFNLELLMGPLQ